MCKNLGAACLGLSMAMSASSVFALADIIEVPSRPTLLAPENLLTDADRAGGQIVAVGERGHIIFSEDEGESWEQAEVPVSVTLTGVDFGTEQHGWAVGHSGVVLHSSDAGESWEIQLTGIRAMELVIESRQEQIEEMEQRIEEAPEEEVADLEWALDDLIFSLQNLESDLDIGPVNPLLDVWFENESHGFVVGAYGMFLRTTDGGETWRDWSPRVDNPTGFHLNSITQITGGGLVIVGEAGQIFVSVDGGDSWEKRESPYEGSLFGAIGTGQVNEILAFGLRGNMLLSTDLGETWKMVPNEAGATLNDGVVADDGRITLVGNGGTVLMSTDGGESFRAYSRDDREGVMDVVPVSGTSLVIVGEGGVKHTDARGKSL
ncbi:photosystem I reaction center subunit IV [Marinobacter vulgaris]|uniref:Photosystem I reaction center subunit IV n=2 Tax=Marinobacter vulgaris TaxID=1928331 RepID=A0A2V3ZJ91_9GAMM|nr:photosystem I reaction center subunit IV [Marinobacter vulgaris]TSJ69876.1 photosystem I reaction center subunit IV [Marinobacter vulgaris]